MEDLYGLTEAYLKASLDKDSNIEESNVDFR